jgi:hypothetical protein
MELSKDKDELMNRYHGKKFFGLMTVILLSFIALMIGKLAGAEFALIITTAIGSFQFAQGYTDGKNAT